jgi:hypothetical protein
MFTATMYTNGTIRNADGKLIGFFDAERGILEIDGRHAVKCADELEAMEIIGAAQ